MIAILLGLGGKLLGRPALLASLIVTLALGGFWTYHVSIVDGSRERYITRLETDNASKAATIANQAVSISSERLIVTTLQRTIEDRNHQIDAQALKLKTIELSAGLAASQAFNQGLAAAKSLAEPTTTVKPGHEPMNGWLKERFGGGDGK